MTEYKEELTKEEIEKEDMEMGIPSWDEIREQEDKERQDRMKTMKPDALIAVHVNFERKVESVEVVSIFHTGEAKYGWDDEFDSYMLEYHGFLGCEEVKPNTLYHVYIHVESYRCSYECDEWETEHYYLQIIPVIENYEDFLVDEEEYEEQQKLAQGEEKLPGIVTDADFNGDGELGWSSYTTLNITYNDIKRMVSKLAEVDIHLAHRIYNGWGLMDMLGEYYNEDIEAIEKKRLDFRSYLRYNFNRDKESKIKYTQDGYKLPKTYRNEAFTISHEEIDNLPDEWLLEGNWGKVVNQMYEAKKVAQKLLAAKGNNKRYVNVVNG